MLSGAKLKQILRGAHVPYSLPSCVSVRDSGSTTYRSTLRSCTRPSRNTLQPSIIYTSFRTDMSEDTVVPCGR